MKALVLPLKNVIFCTHFIANIQLAGLKTTARDNECKNLRDRPFDFLGWGVGAGVFPHEFLFIFFR